MIINPYVFAVAGPTGTTWNPSDTGASTGLSNGNLTATGLNLGATGPYVSRGTVGKSTGKYYYEVRVDSGSGGALVFGVCDAVASLSSVLQNSETGADFATYAAANGTYKRSTFQAAGTTLTGGDVAGIACDFTTGKIWFAKNNTWILSGNPGAGTNPVWTIATSVTYYPVVNTRSVWVVTARFLTASWTYSAPSGFGEWT